MVEQKILRFCIERGFLLDKELLEAFSELEDPESVKMIIESIYNASHQRMITKNFFSNFKNTEQIFSMLPIENQKYVEKLKIKLGLNIEISKELTLQKEIVIDNKTERRQTDQDKFPDVKIISMPHSPGRKIEVEDFSKHFKNRFIEMRNILQEHAELTNLVSIGKISGNRQGITLIGMVSSKRVTKNKNILLQVEDLTGKISVLINVNKPELMKKAEDIVMDDVIAIKCSGSREIVFVNDIIFPEAMLQERKKAPNEIYAAFTGDLHVGSNKFMEKDFIKFIDFLNGKIPSNTDVSKIKYLFIIGDIVCGVGLYPGQDKDLVIKDLEGQFQKAAELLDMIRKDIKIIIAPGNHDGVRNMEPQPVLSEKYAWALHELDNVLLTTNPALVNIGASENFSGLNVLMYHGYSFHYYVDNVPSLRRVKATNKPELIMSFLLKRRHLAPSHQSTLYFPSERDPLLIREIPDIFLSGHTHKSAVTYYNNILIISSSSWESKTDFQEKMGNEPDFCKVPLFNLQTRAIKILDFEGKDANE